VQQGRTQPEEMIEIPLLVTILAMVFLIASSRAKTQAEIEVEHQALKKAHEERFILQEALLHQAFHDGLTDLPNRALLFERLQNAFLEAVRNQQPLSLLFVDLDDFKSVNDRFGHAVGDQLLVEVAKRMLPIMRPEDTVARWGGDEFTVLIKNPLSVEAALGTANRILEKIAEPYQINGVSLNISASIGVTMKYPKGDQPEDLLREADHAMYQAKSGGKSKIHVHMHSLTY
jgi:diguanylate cyclase (GGDEF)-like protein